MEIESVGWRTEIMLRRLSGAEVLDRGDHVVVRTPASPGFYWGNYLLLSPDADPGDLERWTAVFRQHFPGVAHLALAVDGRQPDAPATWVAEGPNLQVHAFLVASRLREAGPREAGVVVRAVQGDEEWAGVAALDDAVYPYAAGDAGQRAHRAQRWAEDRAVCEAGHGVWVAALADGEVRAAAGVLCDGGGVARFQNVATHPDARRRGLAGAVVSHAGALANQRLGAHTLVIAADPEDVAIRLYRTLGFEDAEREVRLQRTP